MNDFPVGQFFILSVAVLGICLGISLLIVSRLSEDKENSILHQLWVTFFSRSNDSDH